MVIASFPRVVWLGIAVLITSLGIRQSFGLFMAPISESFGTGREFFSFAIALQNLLFGVFQPFVGMAADKWGARRVICLGALAYALGLAMTALSSHAELLYISMGALIGLGLSCTSYVIVLGAVAKAVPPEHSAKAFGLTTAAGSFGMFAVIPGAQALLSTFDWQTAMLVFAALCSLMIAFASFIRSPEQARPAYKASASESAATTGVNLKQALAEARAHHGYWLIHAGFFVCGFHVMFIATHLPSYIADAGLSAETAAMALAYVGIFNIFGSYFWGAMGDRFNKRLVMSSLYLIRSFIIAGFIWFPMSESTAGLFGAAIGFCWLGTVPLTSGLVRQIFGAQYMSTLYGLVFLSHQIGSFLGAWVGGLIYDYFGSYDPIWMATVVLALLAAALHVPIDDRPLARLTASA